MSYPTLAAFAPLRKKKPGISSRHVGKRLNVIAATITASCLSMSAHANVFQYIIGLSYSNPAQLFQVKKNEFILGASNIYTNMQYNGKALNFNTFQYDTGFTSSKELSVLPYGRIAHRVNDHFVWGVDVTQPFNSNIVWGDNALTRYASNDTLMTDVDVSPRFSFRLHESFYVGAGLNFNFLKNNENNWTLPTGPTTYAKLINRSSGFGLGYDAGAYWVINQTNFLGVAYYSYIKQKTRGQSLFNSEVNNNLTFNFRFPATTSFTYLHIFSQKWLMNLQAYVTEWQANQYARINNTAAPPPVGPNFIFPVKYHASWAFVGVLRRQMNEKLGLALVGIQDYGPERDHLRSINFPADVIDVIGVSADYHFNKSTSIEALYGHAYYKTLSNYSIPLNGQMVPLTMGRVRANGDVLDLRLKIQMD